MIARSLLQAGLVAALSGAAVASQGVSVHQGVTTIDRNGRVIHHNGGKMVDGSGRLVWQNRPVTGFRQISLSGVGDVEVQLGARPGVAIQTDDNLLGFITTEVIGDTLTIGSKGSFRSSHGVRIRVSAPDLASLKATGSGDIRIANVANDRLAVVLQGSGDLSANGRTSALTLSMRGSGDADLAALASADTTVELLGSGNAVVRAARRLDGRAFGSGSIRFIGKPTVNVRTGGSGSVTGGAD